MDEPTGAQSIQRDQPAHVEVETREETLARVMDEDEAVGAERGGSADPSTRRGLNRVLWRTVGTWAAAGFVLGALVGAVLSIAPGPFETGSVGDAVGYALGLGAAFALVVGMLAALFTLEREDGRVERDVEKTTGEQPAPARPNRPGEDLPRR
jgi:hypothetical protein